MIAYSIMLCLGVREGQLEYAHVIVINMNYVFKKHLDILNDMMFVLLYY